MAWSGTSAKWPAALRATRTSSGRWSRRTADGPVEQPPLRDITTGGCAGGIKE
jgi:hypothetical protein